MDSASGQAAETENIREGETSIGVLETVVIVCGHWL